MSNLLQLVVRVSLPYQKVLLLDDPFSRNVRQPVNGFLSPLLLALAPYTFLPLLLPRPFSVSPSTPLPSPRSWLQKPLLSVAYMCGQRRPGAAKVDISHVLNHPQEANCEFQVFIPLVRAWCQCPRMLVTEVTHQKPQAEEYVPDVTCKDPLGGNAYREVMGTTCSLDMLESSAILAC